MKIKTRHIIIDFETLSPDPMVAIPFELSTMIFDWSRFLLEPYTYSELLSNTVKFKFSIEDMKRIGLKADPSTIDFWKAQDASVRKNMRLSENDLTAFDFVTEFYEFLRKNGLSDRYNPFNKWFSRSNTFDPIIFWNVLNRSENPLSSKIKDAMPHWNVRDTRSLLDGMTEFNIATSFVPTENKDAWAENFVQHDSRHDIVADVLRIQACLRAISGLDEAPIF